eukprot:SAG22_NODE_2501_length_2507_cov_1.744911_2_plen_66_part_00
MGLMAPFFLESGGQRHCKHHFVGVMEDRSGFQGTTCIMSGLIEFHFFYDELHFAIICVWYKYVYI